MGRDAAAYAAWRSRFPIDDHRWDQNPPPQSAPRLPADVSGAMLDHVRRWAKDEATKRGESLRESEPCVSHESQASPADASVAVGPALTPNQSLVPRTTDGFGALELVSTKGIAERMEPSERFSPRTIGP